MRGATRACLLVIFLVPAGARTVTTFTLPVRKAMSIWPVVLNAGFSRKTERFACFQRFWYNRGIPPENGK